MDRTDGRLSLAVLSGAAAFVLTVGGAWWVTAAPERVTLEPLRPEPVPPAVVEPPERAGPESYLPEVPNTLERHVGRLDSGEGLHLFVESTEDQDYLLQYVCIGNGSLRLRVRDTTQGTEMYEVDCAPFGGGSGTIRFTAAEHRLAVDVTLREDEPVEVAMQVVALR
ncbi:DUF6023 family protein [Phytohabitans kaempferiae]|uniref:DUF6023 family protein n=1 Tax=Phytohabitans kaempferiae TaxID=1620943 RepID=A0ABV6MFJ4_9ACTN